MYRVYSIDGCGYCSRTFNLLLLEGLDFEAIKIADDEKVTWMDKRGFGDGERTFPRVFLVDEQGTENLVGGFTETEQKVRNVSS